MSSFAAIPAAIQRRDERAIGHGDIDANRTPGVLRRARIMNGDSTQQLRWITR